MCVLGEIWFYPTLLSLEHTRHALPLGFALAVFAQMSSSQRGLPSPYLPLQHLIPDFHSFARIFLHSIYQQLTYA